jgi:hypothetical protein
MTEMDNREARRKPMEIWEAKQPGGPPLPRRPSYEKLLENIEKWANSSGLQKPT